ncbi:hypothetical protein N0V93_004409 [Gnomoniopsis smithogilvyi]|uniref:Uncharacterized protein n=1 Tax=Gnomoniopsis smithogilvyi TaxID=1191159 RepID=A0A9W8YSJ1_9PEZI|nr:hypothetical protein N0V93_004409 [Gnomoniopsis smithogilvyi]
MAATGRTLSPGGALLRSSRMFSLPNAIPPPPGDFRSASAYQVDTATQPFPTLQTITTPENFRQRGDWGFKRNFPLRATTGTSTPYLRIKQVDSVEHVTDFNSAADHTLTLEKWQELNVAISLPHVKHERTDARSGRELEELKSVFDDKYDFTAIDEEKIRQAGHRRWKYKGPWLANLAEGEFQTYLKKQVRGRRAEFREFLKVQMAADQTEQARKRAMDQGTDEEVPEVRPEDISDEHILDFLRKSRNHRLDLYNYVSKFLDLAPCEPEEEKITLDYLGDMAPGETRTFDAQNPYAKSGPPITHPSAGLSYLRSDSFLDNHPVYGPQQKHRPVQARVLTVKTDKDTVVGVAGFVSPSPVGKSDFGYTDQHDHKTPGGPKTWVNVVSAQINSTGRTIVHVEPATGTANSEARLIQQEMQGETQLYKARSEETQLKHLEIRGRESSLRGPMESRMLRRRRSVWRDGNSSSYGMSSTLRGSEKSPEGRDF